MVKQVERFVVVAPIPGRQLAFGGTVLETLPDGRVVESPLTLIPTDELSQWVSSLNTMAIADNLRLQSELSAMTSERDAAVADKATLTTERNSALEQVGLLESRIAELTAEPDVPIVSRRQARLALLEMGLIETVESAVYAGPKAVQIEYENQVWQADNPVLRAMAGELGMDDAAIDAFFALAGTK